MIVERSVPPTPTTPAHPDQQRPEPRRFEGEAGDGQAALQHRVVNEPDAAAFVNLSQPQLRRLRRDGRGPDYVRLSERRIGYRIGALIAFLDLKTVAHSTEAR